MSTPQDRPGWRRRVAIAGAAVAVGLSLSGCAGSDPATRGLPTLDPPAGMIVPMPLDDQRLIAGETGVTPSPVPADSTDLRVFLALPPSEQEFRREEVCPAWQTWWEFVTWRRGDRPVAASIDVFAIQDRRPMVQRRLAEAWDSLREIVAADPAAALAWYQLGRFALTVGDLATARHDLAMAALARRLAPQCAPSPCDGSGVSEPNRALDLLVAQLRGWTLRELGLWDEGLAVVAEARAAMPHDWELQLLEGLLLAGAGRCTEACDVAAELPAARYPWLTLFTDGLTSRPTDLGSRWICAMAFHAIGETALARHALGEVEASRRFTKHMDRFWNDMGLVLEAAGDEAASLYYGLAYTSRPLAYYYPVTAASCSPIILSHPGIRDAFYRSYGAFYLVGSRFAHAAELTALASQETDPDRRAAAIARALSALERCERWHVWPDHVRALKGRVHFDSGHRDAAEQDLAAARQAFAEQGEVDGTTNLLLGLLYLQREDYDRAQSVLEEAVDADPTSAKAWRSLGVALASRGDVARAREAMDVAVDLEPDSPIGLYNRGLLAQHSGQLAAAHADLERAVELDPSDARIVSAYQAVHSALQRRAGR